MTQKKQGLTSRGAKKRTAPVKRYADGGPVGGWLNRMTHNPNDLTPEQARSAADASAADYQANKTAGEGKGFWYNATHNPYDKTPQQAQDARDQREAAYQINSADPDYDNNYDNEGKTRGLSVVNRKPDYAGNYSNEGRNSTSYTGVGNAGDARFNADRGQLSFTDKNFDPTKQQFADGTGAITGRGGRTVVYSGMGPGQQHGQQGQQPGQQGQQPGQQGLSSAGPQPVGGWSNPYASGTSEHNLFNYGGKNAVAALNTTRGGGGTSDMARQLADLSAQRMGGGQGGDGPSVTMLHSSTPPMTLTPYSPLGGGMTHGLIPSSQRHAESSIYNTNVNAQTAAAANQTALRGQDMGMQSHLQGLDLSGQYNLQNTGLQGRNQLQNTMLQGQSQLQNTGLMGQNQLQNTMMHNSGQLGLEAFKAGTPQAMANAEYSKAHAGLAGAQQRAVNVGLQNENIAQKQISDIANVIRQTPEGMNLSPEALWEVARAQHEQNKPRGGQPDTAHAFNSLQPTPEERQEFQRTGKLPARFQKAAVEHHAGGDIVGQNNPRQGGLPMYPQERQRQPEPVPEWRKSAQAAWDAIRGVRTPNPTPPPTADGLPDTVNRIKTRGQQLQEVANYADGGPIAVGGHQVTDPSGRMDHTGSDSLPAVIDGDPAHPAALTSGEFVFPVEAVQHYGTDRLRKMVAAARKGGPLVTGRQAA